METPHPVLNTEEKLNALRWFSHDYYVSDQHWIISPRVKVDLVQPEASNQAIIKPISSIKHSNAGPQYTLKESLLRYWRRADINGEAHFQISDEGSVQAMPLNRRADCNYKANGWWKNGVYVGAISFETADRGWPTLDQTPWTELQLRDLIGIDVCLSVVYGMSCTACPTWDSSGIGYHSQFKEWSSYIGKTCPGAARIRQMDYIRAEVARRLALIGEATGWRCGAGFPL